MAKFTVQNYMVVLTTIEADTPEQALELWHKLPIEGDLSCPSAVDFHYSASECMGEQVEDEQGNVLIETY